jgi:hypothetical protein
MNEISSGTVLITGPPEASGRAGRPCRATRCDAGPGRAGLAAAPFPGHRRHPGTANPGHLRANVAAAEVAGNLTDAEVARLTGLVDESKAVHGPPHQSTLDAHRSLPRLSQVVARLEQRGWVRRTPDPAEAPRAASTP